MNKFTIVSFLVIFCGLGAALAKHFWRGELMSMARVCKTWPQQPFDSKKFSGAAELTRATMACSLLQNRKRFIGKDRSEIRKELGDFDGFYFSDMFPAYMIQSGHSKEDESWQIVFLLDSHEKVSEVVVHKNCCN